jgi:hypothetical protein
MCELDISEVMREERLEDRFDPVGIVRYQVLHDIP